MNPQHLCMGCMVDNGGAPSCPQCGYREGQPVTGGGPHLPPRTLLNGRYLIGRVLGEGGFGITYLAYDLTLTLKLAIKEFLPRGFATRAPDRVTVSAYTDGSGEAQQMFVHGLEKFLEEARILARFNEHPGIVAVRDFFAANGSGYLVMNYLDGMTLKQYVAAQGGRLPFSQALQLLSPVMNTLREVHAAGLAHRDISPDNIYITREQQVKLIDFGAARFAMTEGEHSLSIIFKRGFAPVEQYHTHGRQGAWTDVYALAGTFYYALTGKAPPEAPARVLEDPLQLPSALGVELPGTTEAVLLKGLAVRAEARYRTVEAFRQALEKAITEERTQILPAQTYRPTPVHPEQASPDPLLPTVATARHQALPVETIPHGKNRWIPLLGISTLGVLAIVGWTIMHHEDAPQPAISPVENTPPKPPISQPTANPVIPASTPLLIQLSTPRGTNPRYYVGEHLDLNIQVSEDSYLYCYYRDESGKIARIYPNRYAPDSYSRAGQRIDIPGQNTGFSIEFTQASQNTEVLCLASKQEFATKLPLKFKAADLEPMSVESLGEVMQTFQAIDAPLTYQRLQLAIIGR